MELTTNTAELHLAAAPSASTRSTMPAAMVTGNVPAWIHPRQVGLRSSGEVSSASSRGRLGMSSSGAMEQEYDRAGSYACPRPGRSGLAWLCEEAAGSPRARHPL